jgi:hypothetical protein
LYAIPFELGRLGVLLVTAAGWYGVSQFFTYSSPWLTLCVRTGFVLLFPAVLFCCRFFRAGELEFVTQLFSRTQRTPEKACVQA